jgi:methylated-DNA-[protein]-cysteine S-methyltransferase
MAAGPSAPGRSSCYDESDESIVTASSGFALFETAIGTCGVAWGLKGVLGLVLPESSRRVASDRLARMGRGLVEAVPPFPAPIDHLIRDIHSLLAGARVDLEAVTIDFSRVPEFDRRVYEVARAIPPGRTLTYGDVATRLGDPGLARAVGQALGRNPFPIVVPCHRVVAAAGAIGGFSAVGGAATKRRMLAIESAQGTLPFTHSIR